MDPFLGLLVVAILVAAASGAALGGTAAGQRQLDHWETITSPGNQRTELGRRAAAIGRVGGWVATGAARAVRAATAAIRARRGGSSSATTATPDSPIGGGATPGTPVDPAPPGVVGGSTYTPPDEPGPAPDAPAGGTFTGPEYATRPAPAGPDSAAAAALTAEFAPVDGQVVPNTYSLPGQPGEPTASAALGAAPHTQEEPVSGAIVVAGAAITYEVSLAAAAACHQNAAAMSNNANITAGGIEHMIACLQTVGLRDDSVYSALYTALEATRDAQRAAERLNAAASMAHNALVAGHGTAAAALAGNSTAATNSGFYTGGV